MFQHRSLNSLYPQGGSAGVWGTAHTPSPKRRPREWGVASDMQSQGREQEKLKKKKNLVGVVVVGTRALWARAAAGVGRSSEDVHLAGVAIFNGMLWTLCFCFSHFKNMKNAGDLATWT